MAQPTSDITGVNPTSGKVFPWTQRWDPSGKKSDGLNYFGYVHPGLDVACPVGTSLKSPADCTIISVGVDSQYGGGTYVKFQCKKSGMMIWFFHCSKVVVRAGISVTAGTEIALSGNSGTKTDGAHLHIQMSLNGVLVNPELYFFEE